LAVEIPAKIYNAVEAGFSTLKVQSRFAVYRLFDEILTTRVERLKPTGAEFIDMIYDLCSNERDPRNLLRLLHTTEIILASFDAETLTTKQEVIYEFLMKYFPISFRSKPDDPSAIKAEDLQLALRKCFSVWSGFSEKFFPDLIPRLDDPNRINVKEDVLLTMKACVDKYEPVDVAKASTSLWNALKYEVFNHGDSSQAENATAVIRAIATNLSANLPFQLLSDSALAKYVKLVSGDCFEKITEKNPRFALASGKLLATVATASPLAYHLVMKEALPKLIKAVKKNDATLDEHKSTLLIINSILESKFLIFKFQEHWDFPAMSVIDKLSQAADSQSEDALFQHKDELNDIFMGVASDNNLQDNELRSASIEGLSKLVRLPSFLDRESVETIIKFFTARVVAIGDIHDSLWQQLVDALKFSTASHSQIIMESTFPVLLSRLPDQYDPSHTSQYYAAITALAQISSEQLNLYETVWRRLISQLDHVVSANEGQDYAHIILAGLLQAVLYREAANMSANTSDPLEKLAVQFSAIVKKVIIVKWQRDEIQDLRVSGFKLAGSTSQVPDRISLDLIGRILLTLLRQLTAEQQTIALAYAFRDEDGPEPRIVKSDNVQDLDIGTASEAVKKIGARFIKWLDLKQERSLITIAKYIFGGLRREVCYHIYGWTRSLLTIAFIV
jgi:DNA repair/transcription protein MET18/MMS19